jgi:hypothetical protein
MADIKSASILILATDGYERSELRVPWRNFVTRVLRSRSRPSRAVKSRAGTKPIGATASTSTFLYPT